MHPRRLLASSLVSALAALPLLAGVPAAAAPVEETPVNPAALERGADPAVPQVLGSTILDGDRRVDVPAQELWLLGTTGDDYVVAAYGKRRARVLRVAPDGTHTTLLPDFTGDLTLSGDGTQLFETRLRDERSVVKVHDTTTGELLVRRVFRGYVWILDADEQRAVVSRLSPSRTFWWHTGTDDTERISKREGYFADIAHNLVATLDGDPYDGGCSVLAPLSEPSETVWRSCKHAVTSASPNGKRLATTLILADGPNPLVRVHRTGGKLLARYRAVPGWFGSVTWEDNRSLLMQVHSEKRSTIARCVLDECERASKRVRS